MPPMYAIIRRKRTLGILLTLRGLAQDPQGILATVACSESSLHCELHRSQIPTQLDATASVAGSLVYSPKSGTVLNAGTQTLNVTFTPTQSQNYTSLTASVPLQVNQAIPIVTWPAPAAITYPTALSATQLNAKANVGGAFVYAPAAGTVLNPGAQTLSVQFAPSSSSYAPLIGSVTLQVNQGRSDHHVPTHPKPLVWGSAAYPERICQLGSARKLRGGFWPGDCPAGTRRHSWAWVL